MIDLNKEVQFIKGVGPSRVALLNNLGIYTLGDLISYYPREYEDRSRVKKIAEFEDKEKGLVEVTCMSNLSYVKLRRNMSMCKLKVADDSSEMLITWFNQDYLRGKFKAGDKVKFYGKMSVDENGRCEMNSPIFDSIDENKNTGRIVPIYRTTKKLSQNILRKIIEDTVRLYSAELEESLPDYIIDMYKLNSLSDSTLKIHFPDNYKDINLAHERLAFEELLTLQLALLSIKHQNDDDKVGIAFDENVMMSDVINDLDFKLTKAQLRVLEEIDKDMESSKPMNRLLQGDVGSGKTIVSMIAAYKAVKSGYQVAIMVPTTILASQHLVNFKKILEKYNINIELLISSNTKKQKEETLKKLKDGTIDIIIGTHSLLEENVEFNNLGLVVTDEQHRFGVKQRTTIISKGNNPDVLVMTATPIPRTLAIILYGDLDISIIDELPPNRKEIETYAVRKDMDERVNNFIKKNIDEGRQAYIVCPLVDENEDLEDVKSIEELAKTYKDEVFKDYKVEILHGKMKPKEKEQVMVDFKDGKIDILIATTVIEVGVDVPNSNIMLIENAERFGLAQLHQLRGRVGRGEYQSYCILKYQGKSDVIRERMEIMTKTNDGFKVAEKDLELRGSGEFFGTKQHGIPEFKVANLFEDIKTLKQVQELSINILKEDPNLKEKKNEKLSKLVNNLTKNRIEI